MAPSSSSSSAIPPLSESVVAISGFSDAILLAVSIVGFGILTVTVYSIIWTRLSKADPGPGGRGRAAGNNDAAHGVIAQNEEEEYLLQADVGTLNRAQRRARAKLIMKQQRRLAVAAPRDAMENDHDHGDGHENEMDDDDEDDNDTAHGGAGIAGIALSRKDRQMAAKAEERIQRRLLADQRQAQQQEEQRKAQQLKLERKRAADMQLMHQAEQRHEKEAARDALERAAWSTFLSTESISSTSDGSSSDTANGNSVTNETRPLTRRTKSVAEFCQDCQTNRVQRMADLAQEFGTTSERVVHRIQQLLNEGRIAGYFQNNDDDNQGVFVAVSDAELAAMASVIQKRNEILTLDTVAAICEGILKGKDE